MILDKIKIIYKLYSPMSKLYEFDTIVEIPKDSKVKYEFCCESNKIRVDRILPSAYNYPYNYGYVENTTAEDGDSLDVVVMSDQPIFPMSVIRVKPVGILYMRDGKNIDHLERDPKILAYPVYSVDRRYKNINSINDIPELDKIILKDFFTNYKNNENKITIVDGFGDYDEAINVIEESKKCFLDSKPVYKK
jgi:inorganic pyrophosphatase